MAKARWRFADIVDDLYLELYHCKSMGVYWPMANMGSGHFLPACRHSLVAAVKAAFNMDGNRKFQSAKTVI
jgi:hypothetical protein